LADPASALVQGLSVSVIGITVFAMAALRRTNADLVATRQELAALAVAEERHRIARDLHDVLGHSLSLIAIKSELAGRLLPGDPERARAEIADVEQVARDSLASVRETVGGYRQPTLERELANAKVVLDAAGIEPTIEHRVGELPEPEDTVLAWVLREAVTNVVRHSAAHHGTIRTTRTGATAALEVVDDGAGPPTDAPADGSGLAGLRERLERIGGRLEAGHQPSGGFRLVATVPIPAGPVSS
jgi:two-component system sensor histidine kinase DesK